MTMSKRIIGNDWDEILKKEYKKSYFINLMTKVKQEYDNYEVYPKFNDIFNAFNYTPFSKVKVVILGQDPYHNPNEAHGFSFSVPLGKKVPKSLQNIFKEINTDIEEFNPTHGNLISWVKQGVLLLNTVLTVRENDPGSHKNLGWEVFTDFIIQQLDKKEEPVVFLLWGNFAKNKEKLIKNRIHLVLKSAHPSPLSAYRGFYGCRHFSKANEFLKKNDIKPINWKIT